MTSNIINPPLNYDELPLTDEMVSTYLADNPDFFNRNPSILNGLRVVEKHRGTISLVERQQQQLRQKVHLLEEEITQLMAIANQNESLFALYSDLYLRLMDCESASELLDCLYQATTELLSLSGLTLWLVNDVDLQHKTLTANNCNEILENRLATDNYYFGRLQQSEQQMIFSKDHLGSVVLIKLEAYQQGKQGETIGFLAISSDDAEHFEPRMDTLLLNQFRKLVAKLLAQHLYS